MNEEIPQANPPLTAEERAHVDSLTDADLQIVDAAILSEACNRWRKVARIAMRIEGVLNGRYPNLSYIFYAQRLRHLVERGLLESQGNPEYMRFSEARISTETGPIAP
jgi:hypothetical protein